MLAWLGSIVGAALAWDYAVGWSPANTTGEAILRLIFMAVAGPVLAILFSFLVPVFLPFLFAIGATVVLGLRKPKRWPIAMLGFLLFAVYIAAFWMWFARSLD